MLAVTQRSGHKLPGTVYCCSNCRQQRAVVVNGNPGVGLRRTAQHGAGIVGPGTARQRAGARLYVIKGLDNGGCQRGDGIHNQGKPGRRHADVAGRVGGCHRQHVIAVTQRTPRCKIPYAVSVCRNRVDKRAVVIDFDRRIGLRRTVKGRARIVCRLTVVQISC